MWIVVTGLRDNSPRYAKKSPMYAKFACNHGNALDTHGVYPQII